ncbi:Blp family class II bacteriocin [Enterococcus faecalis]|nr:ComC/BlpC family peptide pheromone/bacteriocin [Enterococcus faecalis]MDY4070642.1 Blp family class II bacteriocin [Enterococcus gallinarum]OOG24465.1 hypothetical protein BZK37_14560 [Enterococcus casseliflavus]EGO6638289.1 ComC/BlpC family peptide pheromone/bacteriocin [Enterococcus faecalis]EHQ2711007.1 Blp family class II bacteriocin [Enterococcus faecalis]
MKLEIFKILEEDSLQNVLGGGALKNLIYGMGGGAAGGAALGAAICAPTVVGAPACSIVGGLYGAVAGGFAAGLDTINEG